MAEPGLNQTRAMGGSRDRRPLAYWLVLLALGVAAEALTVANLHTWRQPLDAAGIGTVFAITYGAAGALILLRQPGNSVGQLFFYVTTVMVVCQLSSEYAIYAYVTANADLPLRAVAGWLSQWTFFAAFPVGLSLVFLFFPDGLKPGRKWRAVLGLALVGGAWLTLAFLLTKGPIGPSDRGNGDYFIRELNPTGLLTDPNNGVASAVQGLGWMMSGIALILSVAASVIRLVQERGERRQQLKWVAYLAAPVAPTFAIHFFDLAIFNGAFPDYTKPYYIAVYMVGIPAAMAIAILRYRLYGIDVVVNRALVYAALAGFITAVYVGIVVGVGSVIGQGGRPNLVLSIIATAVVAVGFQPLRERLQRVANRLVYGRRATPYEVLSQFSGRVAESYSADDVLPRMVRVLAEGTGAEKAEVWLRSGAELRQTAAWPPTQPPPAQRGEAGWGAPVAITGQLLPAIPEADRAVAVRHQGELLGALTVSKRRGESLTPIEEKLLDDLAHQAGLVLKNVGLTADLQARLEDLRESRKRLVAAQDQERRRLERNLHDGAQQHLVALKVKLGLAEMLAVKDPDKAKGTIAELKADADDALETLRELARGIYPPLLADKGLATALEAQARKATLPVTVEAQDVGRYPQEVEAAAYFCCLEALQNVQKYAQASHVVIRLVATDAGLAFAVEDDGVGFDPASVQPGAGLSNMRDRLDALGGELSIRATSPHGAVVAGRLPLAVGVAP